MNDDVSLKLERREAMQHRTVIPYHQNSRCTSLYMSRNMNEIPLKKNMNEIVNNKRKRELYQSWEIKNV